MRNNHPNPIFTILIMMLAVMLSLPGCTFGRKTSQGASPVGIRVFFKLDPRLLGPTYGNNRWVSPPTYGPILHPGDTYIVEARAEAVDDNGERLPVNIEWIPEDSRMVSVSPNHGNEVTINIQHPGESHLEITSQNASKTLTVKAVYRQNNVIEVEITQ